MKKKKFLITSVLVLAVMLRWGTIAVEAYCEPWQEILASTSYCATPICHTGNRTYFVERQYKRLCVDGLLWDFHVDHKIEKVNKGCCPYN